MPAPLILGIESSCDETSAAVVRAGTEVLSNVVASQLIHASYGGVVPELASREHLRAIVPVVREALAQANVTYADLAAIAVTEGPGLAGALLVGITFAKAAALGAGLPLIAVNHLEGHIHAVLMDAEATFAACSPLLALVVSGGHTHLYLANRTPQNTWTYRNVGKTLDDAAGEAYDKVAKLLGLPYPGGPWMDALAQHGDPRAVPFTFAQIKPKRSGKTAPKLAHKYLRQEAALKGTGFSPYVNTAAGKGASAPEETASKGTGFSPYINLPAENGALASEETALKGTGFSPYVNTAAGKGASAPEETALKGTSSSPYINLPAENGALASEEVALKGTGSSPNMNPAIERASAPEEAALKGTGFSPYVNTAAGKGASAPEETALKGTSSSPYINLPAENGALAPEAEPDPRFDLSFSGIKTAVRRYTELHHMRDRIILRESTLRQQGIATAKPSDPAQFATALATFDPETLNLIASFQASVTAYLTHTALAAAAHFSAQGILVSGGVAANRELRQRLTAAASAANLVIAFPTIALSTDNAAMIAAAAWPKLLARDFAPTTLEPTPQLRLG